MNEFTKSIHDDEDSDHEPTFEGPLSGFGQQRAYEKKPPGDPTNPTDKTVKAYKYDFDHRVFLIFRPWAACPVCMKLFKAEALPLGQGGSYECPHTNKEDYLILARKFLKEGYVCSSRREEILRDGTVLMSIAWLIPEKKQASRPVSPRM